MVRSKKDGYIIMAGNSVNIILPPNVSPKGVPVM